MEWPIMKLAELASREPAAIKIGPFGSQLKKSELVDSGIHVIGIENVLNNKFDDLGDRYITADKFQTLRSVEVKPGDVLITMMGTIGEVAIVPEGINTSIMDSHLLRYRPNTALCSPEYIAFLIKGSSATQAALRGRAHGAIMKGLNSSIIKSLPAPLPPPSEQRRIVAILGQAGTLREKRAEANFKAKRIVPALFYKMFGDPASNPKNWDIKEISNGGASVRYGLGQPPEADPDGIPLIRATNISRGVISDEDMVFVSHSSVPETRNAFLTSDEVIVVRSGAYTGDVAQVTDQWAGSVAGYDLIVTPGENFCGEFVEAYLLTPHIQKNYFSNLKARAGQPHLNASQLSATPILCPPKDLQLCFAEQIRSIRQLRNRIAFLKQRLDVLFSVLFFWAFSGELTAKWRKAHMEEILVEMEQQQKYLKRSSDLN